MDDTLTAKLLEHAKRVCEAVIGENASSRVSVEVFAPRNENIPASIPPTHKFMVFVDITKAYQLMPELQESFTSFLCKDVRAYKTDASVWLYWGEGEPFAEASDTYSAPDIHNKPKDTRESAQCEAIEWFKADTILPIWLDRLLFESLEARHKPDWKKFAYNLDLDEDDIKAYLGTYFPRSYAEAFCIMDALFGNNDYITFWENRKEAWLLDIGSGTGGNLIGLLTALVKHCPHLATIHVHGFDGNPKALCAAKTVLEAFARQTPTEIDITLTAKHIGDTADLPAPTWGAYDFITSFKMGGEIISSGGGSSNGFYHRFLSTYVDLLSDIGLLILLDVTTKPEHADFYPQILNQQVSQFVRTKPEFATLVPVPCHLFEGSCFEPCFTQMEFGVSHRAARNDLSRVAYRVLARKFTADTFHVSTNVNAQYVICRRAAHKSFSTCKHSSGQAMLLDGFRPNKF